MMTIMWSHGGFGFGLWFVILAALVVVPFWRILPRHGIPAWVSLVAILPIGALILLWVVAFKDDVSQGDAS